MNALINQFSLGMLSMSNVNVKYFKFHCVIVSHFCLPLKLPCPEITHELIRAYFLYMI